jgi:adenine-specific DNA-methyltransferase
MPKMSGQSAVRRASRLSEGSAPRSLDYYLSYAGKKTSDEILVGPKSEPAPVFSVTRATKSWRNRLYYGDNLRVLRALLEDEQICQKVKLIYIDPPFATGSVFESRNGKRAYEDVAFGASYIEFIRERLILLRELLHMEGSIYLHLDGKMACPIKIIMDEVFGPSNFRNFITRKKSNRKNYTRKQYGNISDYILFYSKTDTYTWHRPHEPWTENAAAEYNYTEPGTGRRFMKVPVHAPGIRKGETGHPWRGMNPPPGKHWQYTPKTLDEMDARGEIYWSPNGNPRRKIYLDESKGIPIQDIWLDCRDAHNQNILVTGYPTEKPVEMLRRIITASSDTGDLVLDCFVGSGTTIISAEESSRKWVGIDSGLEAITTTVTRLAKGSEPMGDYVNGKKKNAPGLFGPPSPLQTAFDLFSEQPISRSLLEKWNNLF